MTSNAFDQTGFLASLRRLAASIDLGFCKLTRIQWQAPWRTDRRAC